MKLIRLGIDVLMAIVFFTGITSNSVLATPLPIKTFINNPWSLLPIPLPIFYNYPVGVTLSSGYVFGGTSSGSAESLYVEQTAGEYFIEGASGSYTSAMASYCLFGCSAYGEVRSMWSFLIAAGPGQPAQLMASWNTIMDDSSEALLGSAGGRGRLTISAYSQQALPGVDLGYHGSTPSGGLSGSKNFGWLPADYVIVSVRFDARSDVELPALIGFTAIDTMCTFFDFKIWLDDGGIPPTPAPAPASAWLVVTGLAGLAPFVRRRFGHS
jgi:hypothetical protein